MTSALEQLEKWYAARCDGLWEHGWGIKIETLDNPGWTVHIDLNETRKDGAILETVKIERSDRDWTFYWLQVISSKLPADPRICPRPSRYLFSGLNQTDPLPQSW